MQFILGAVCRVGLELAGKLTLRIRLVSSFNCSCNHKVAFHVWLEVWKEIEYKILEKKENSFLPFSYLRGEY